MQDDLKLGAYHYHLPEKNIAQFPSEKRDHSRLLVLNRTTGLVEHFLFHQISGLFNPGDLLVLNDTKVFPARLHGRKESGGKAEVFLLGYPAPGVSKHSEPDRRRFRCEALIKSSRPPRRQSIIIFDDQFFCQMIEECGRGRWLIELVLEADTDLKTVIQGSSI